MGRPVATEKEVEICAAEESFGDVLMSVKGDVFAILAFPKIFTLQETRYQSTNLSGRFSRQGSQGP